MYRVVCISLPLLRRQTQDQSSVWYIIQHLRLIYLTNDSPSALQQLSYNLGNSASFNTSVRLVIWSGRGRWCCRVPSGPSCIPPLKLSASRSPVDVPSLHVAAPCRGQRLGALPGRKNTVMLAVVVTKEKIRNELEVGSGKGEDGRQLHLSRTSAGSGR
jgi:hypothetical protein